MEDQSIHIARGNAAEELLNSEAFRVASNELVNSYMAAIIQSGPEDKQGRERAYAAIKGVQEVVGTLNQWMTVKAQIMQAAQQDEDNEE